MQFRTRPRRAVRLWRESLHRRESSNFLPNSAAYASILRSCASTKALLATKRFHNQLEKAETEHNSSLRPLSLQKYINCGALKEARDWFDQMHEGNVLSWNLMIGACVRQGHPLEAFSLFELMQKKGLVADKVTFVYMLSACPSIDVAKQLYATITIRGFESDIVVGTALVTMYGRCGSLEEAQKMFDLLAERNVVSWNAVLAMYSQNARGKNSLQLFNRMHQEGTLPDKISFINVISGCSGWESLSDCKRLHACIINYGLESDTVIATALVSVYGKCGRLYDARLMFNQIHLIKVVSWNAMITVYACQGCNYEAFLTFNQMHHEGVMADKVTFIALLDASSNQASLIHTKRLHVQIIQRGYVFDVVVATALISVYGKCGKIDDAQVVFDKMQERNVVSWNAMIVGCAQCGCGKEALQHYRRMQGEGFVPNKVTYVGVISACASHATLATGKMMHSSMVHGGSDVENALINMYGKCGSLEDAQRVFDEMLYRTGSSWNALISTYSHHGDGRKAIQLLANMQHEGLTVDDMTFMSVLSACSHDGLLLEGYRCLMSMNQECCVTPTVEHYDCMIDLFCRAGQLDEAKELMKKMPYPPTLMSWTALLGAYRNHVDVECRKYAVKPLLH